MRLLIVEHNDDKKNQMAHDIKLAERVREYLAEFPGLKIEEKRMFSGLAFMVNSKMCINVSGDTLMCRFDPVVLKVVSEKPGFKPMIMKGRQLNGYCYVEPFGLKQREDFEFWLNLCLDYNKIAKASRK